MRVLVGEIARERKKDALVTAVSKLRQKKTDEVVSGGKEEKGRMRVGMGEHVGGGLFSS